MLLIPCSGRKSTRDHRIESPTILQALDPQSAEMLASARATLREKAAVDESILAPAHERYAGHLYEAGASAIQESLLKGGRVLIISGGYGLLLAGELIGTYEQRFAISDWPKGLLERCLISYAKRSGVDSVVAIMSSTTDYGKLVRRTDWRGAGLRAVLLSPVMVGKGAMVKVPRTQGEAIDALASGRLSSEWRSRDRLGMDVENLGIE